MERAKAMSCLVVQPELPSSSSLAGRQGCGQRTKVQHLMSEHIGGDPFKGQWRRQLNGEVSKDSVARLQIQASRYQEPGQEPLAVQGSSAQAPTLVWNLAALAGMFAANHNTVLDADPGKHRECAPLNRKTAQWVPSCSYSRYDDEVE
ncbi:hypothetical protein CIHG_07809 [Coccidioides immitis H538.4]|uniref:Uncharacterized protein n=1 Tax=Coccidioides immitis H538.4 TaxID=396776 RepID=A0A0J8RYV3_COCIT|nr:hypothetical protein CIHG_07809 [Coccidioides immitis H538.4]